MVDLYGAVTAVSLCSAVIDLSQSCTATISHSQTNVLTPPDTACVDVVCELAETNDVTASSSSATAAAAAVVCLLIVQFNSVRRLFFMNIVRDFDVVTCLCLL